MIEKIIPGDSQEELIKACGQMIQVYESGRHIKSAASNMFGRKDLEKFAPPKGKFLSHMITMGSSEMYGPNRNADLWGHEQLLKKHATFVTHGRNYREHKNTDPKYAVGEIKAEAYDPVKQRGEVQMWTDIDKAASEFEKARKGEEQHGSMAASVDHDVCTCCGFISKTASQRCDHIRFDPGKYFPKLQKYALMDNIDPTFKDYSWVKRPADRIAHTLNYLLPNQKAASADRNLRGDELALLYGAEHPALPVLRKIAEFDQLPEHPAKQAAALHLLPKAFAGQWDPALLEKMSGHAYPGRVLRSALNRQLVMPLASFDAFVSGRSLAQSEADDVVKEASAKLAGIRMMIIQKLDQDPAFGQGFSQAASEFEPMSCGCEDIVDQFMDGARDQFSLRYEALAKRAAYNEGTHVKLATVNPVEVSDQAFGLGALYHAYLTKVAEYLDDDWMLHGQLAQLR